MAYKKISGIYKILCIGSGKPYIGSAVCLNSRWACHRNLLRNKKHSNKHLQNSWNKYGEDSFVFSVIENCPNNGLRNREQYWIDLYKAYDPLLGMNNSPTASTTIGFRHSEGTKKFLSDIAKTRGYPAHFRAYAEAHRGEPGHSKGKPGKKWTEEEKKAASESRKGQVPWNVGVPMPADVRKRVSDTLRICRRVIKNHVREKIKALRAAGNGYQSIANLTGVSLAQTYRIANDVWGRGGSLRAMRTVEKIKGGEANR